MSVDRGSQSARHRSWADASKHLARCDARNAPLVAEHWSQGVVCCYCFARATGRDEGSCALARISAGSGRPVHEPCPWQSGSALGSAKRLRKLSEQIPFTFLRAALSIKCLAKGVR